MQALEGKHVGSGGGVNGANTTFASEERARLVALEQHVHELQTKWTALASPITHPSPSSPHLQLQQTTPASSSTVFQGTSMLLPVTTGLAPPPLKPRRGSSNVPALGTEGGPASDTLTALPPRSPTSPKPTAFSTPRRVHSDSFSTMGTQPASPTSPHSPITPPSTQQQPQPPPPHTTAKVFRLPNDILAQNLPKDELLRQSALYEIIDSEADYVRDLHLLIELHLRPLRAQHLLDDRALRTLFSNVEALLPVNQGLLTALIGRRDVSVGGRIEGVGDIFSGVADQLHVYRAYCSNYPLAMQLYKQVKGVSPMKEYIEGTMNQVDYRGLSLESYLIKPVQRVCKYPLLLRVGAVVSFFVVFIYIYLFFRNCCGIHRKATQIGPSSNGPWIKSNWSSMPSMRKPPIRPKKKKPWTSSPKSKPSPRSPRTLSRIGPSFGMAVSNAW